MQARGRRRAAQRHVEGRTRRADRVLNFDGDRRIGPLMVRGGADHHVDVGAGQTGIIERPFRRSNSELGHDGEVVVIARRNARRHSPGIEDTVQRVHMACRYAGRMGDELLGRFRQRRLAGAGAARVLGVDIGVEAFDQLAV